MQKNCFSYPVEFVEGAFGDSPVLAELLAKIGDEDAGVMIVADMNVVQRMPGLGARIGKYVQTHGIRLVGSPVVVAAGEKIKADNLQCALTIVSALLEAKLGKNDIVLAIGGGTLLDVAGYAAAQVRGGIGIVRMPTTPAAMMDAAFADYAAVDSTNVKDALRVASVPSAVVIDFEFAASVLDGVWCGGIGEAVRLGASSSATLMKKLYKLGDDYHRRDMGALAEIVQAVVAVRKKSGPTPLALWSSARLEAMSGYKLPHGYAVPIGICLSLGYSVEIGLMKAGDCDSVIKFMTATGAMDGLAHSQHIFTQVDSLLFGLDAWRLSSGSRSITVCTAIGKSKIEENPQRDVFAKVLRGPLFFPVKA